MHVGIILDGNRRYGEKIGEGKLRGHLHGAKQVEKLIDWCVELGLDELTLFTFSTENFNRSLIERETLFGLFRKHFSELKEDPRLNDVKVNFSGRINMFPEDMQNIMEELMEKTFSNNKLTVNFAMAYGGRFEIIDAVNSAIRAGFPVTEESFKEHLQVSNDVDLIIRTSGEKRLSGFLPYQGVYAELFFLDKYWPEFEKEDLVSIIEDFKRRSRRFGK